MKNILGVNRRTYPTQERAGSDEWSERPPSILVVLVEGTVGDYAAYCGIGEPQWVARHGDKLSFDEASIHFPVGLKKQRYRA